MMLEDMMYHGDLRLLNICFNNEFNPKLIDLNNSGKAVLGIMKEIVINDLNIYLIANLDIPGRDATMWVNAILCIAFEPQYI